MANLETLRDELRGSSRNIVITTHFKPDGDALGSSLGLYHWLKGQGHRVHMIAPSDFPYFLDWLPGREEVLIYTHPDHRPDSDRLIAEAEYIFCLDFNSLGRLHELAPAIGNASAVRVMIDHHLDPEGFDDFRYWDDQAAATAQLVYGFLVDVMEASQDITPDIATCLYTGIMTDTGSFRFRATTAAVHRIIANLIERGAQNWVIHEHIYNSNSLHRLRFLGHALLNRMEVLPEYNTAYIPIAASDLIKFDIGTGETEGLVNYALSMEGIRLAALIIERGDVIKLSFRSIGDFPCNELSREHFNGGGHLNAAGGNSAGTLEEVVERFKSILPTYKNLLTLKSRT